ncbi:DNA-binding HxlR family transcriptional regulator [Pedobacter cryoconitis]|uniref:DNA-binding HxlR family transcriptional regulator n=1 Tax=Pedobacter cryoconitis TaxID=188932 RepID=A0A7W8ZRB0_9SPHI|nr:helix-turn-helix domain-containing protein [Pedobacter cryoconitis]MBB5638756.1 DNA-binding HxlR family transcriptional regulator [Pedobacter cryoconitis]MBB6270234.1 DNA-binding HxlR family transcriptional regulator [Pedobacter cryoconitis]
MIKTTSTNYINAQTLHGLCDAAYTLAMISGRWKLTLLVKLREGNQRFSELKTQLPAITERVLALQLKELEKSGLIIKKASALKSKLYHYELSPLGKSLDQVIQSLSDWGKINNLQSEL